ncbi:MAG: homoserine dehydrogenase [Clostridia bacterium]|nr:homoserine dehydrogenase [Clostridia bacterium]
MAKETIYIGLLGFGTVGSGVFQLLQDNSEIIAMKVGRRIEVKRILVSTLEKPRPASSAFSILTTDPANILEDPSIDVVVEVMGGITPSKEYILAALKAGKTVVTANKDIMASYGKELFDASQLHGADILFEASVGGGIPIIHALKESLAGNRIKSIMGIVNGTTNYILTQMSREGKDYGQALKEAQKLGYAESNPEADVEGRDAARKLAILASIGFSSRVTYEQVYAEGITRVTPEDIAYAHELGYTIKLLAIAREVEGEIEARVHPVLIPVNHPLASINDEYNAIFVEGDAVGPAMFYGKGAGRFPTASAVVGDIIMAARDIVHGVKGRISCTCFNNKRVKAIEEIETKYYLRLTVTDQPGVLAGIAGVFGNQKVSLASVIQKRTRGSLAEIVLVTHKVCEANIREALRVIEKLPTISSIDNVIRVEEGENA